MSIKKKKLFHIFLPSFENYSGHEIQFKELLTLYAKKKKLLPNFILPKENHINFRQNNFKIIFGKKKSFFLFKIFNIFLNYFCLKNYFKKNVFKKNDNLFYLDGYSFYFLISLIFFFLTYRINNNNKIILWIRYPFSSFLKNRIFKFFLYILNFKFKNQVYLTENSLLQKKLKKNFKLKKIYTMPSIHNLFYDKRNYSIKKKRKNKKYFLISCPGGYRYEKYGKNLIHFLEKNKNFNFKLLISKDSRKNLLQSNLLKFDNIIFRKDNISLKDHLNEIINSDAIILPYEKSKYFLRTSGLFFETISLSKPTFISDGTLPANDLRKFHLNYLIVKNWGCLRVTNMMDQIRSRKNIHQLKKFSSYYKKINGIKSFVNKLYQII